VNAARLGISYKGPVRDLAGIGRNGMIIILLMLLLTIAAITFIRNSSLVAERGGIVCLDFSCFVLCVMTKNEVGFKGQSPCIFYSFPLFSKPKSSEVLILLNKSGL
jgi:hypothetical protein